MGNLILNQPGFIKVTTKSFREGSLSTGVEMSNDQIVEMLKSIGPWFLSAVGALLAFVMQHVWNGFKAWQKDVGERTTKLEEKAREEEGKTSQALLGLRAELHLTKSDLRNAIAGMHNLEGGMKLQQGDLKDLISQISSLDGKFQAVFRFIEASPRATDIK